MLEILLTFYVVYNTIYCIPLLSFTIILFLLKPVDMLKEVALETGKASGRVVAASTYAIFIGVSIVVRWVLDVHFSV